MRTRLVLVAALPLAACGGDGTTQVSDSGFGAFEVSLAASAEGIALGWYDTRDGNAEIYLRVVDGVGLEQQDEFRLTNTAADSYEVELAAIPGGYVASWYEREPSRATSARLARWSPESGVAWERRIGSVERESRNPVVRAAESEVFVAWIESGRSLPAVVWGGWWGFDGAPTSEPFEIGPAGDTTWNLNASVDSRGRVYVVFDATADPDTPEEVFVARVDGTDVELWRVTSADGQRSKYPDIGFDADRVALTWFDERDGNREVYLFVGSAELLVEGIESQARRVTVSAGESIGAYLCWNDGEVGLAWSDDTTGSFEVYFQTFGRDGEASSPIRRLTNTDADSLIPAIRPWRDRFAIAWNEVVGLAESGEPDPHDAPPRSEVVLSLVR